MHALWGLTMSLGAFKVPSAADAGGRRRRRSHTTGDKLDSRPDGRQHAGEVRSGPIATSLTLDAKHSPTFSFIHRVDASHHNNLFYGPYGTSYEIQALARSSGEVIERCWFLGTYQMLLCDGKLPLVFQGTAAKPAQDPISVKALPSQPDSGRVVEKS